VYHIGGTGDTLYNRGEREREQRRGGEQIENGDTYRGVTD